MARGRITQKQENFISGVVDGHSQSEAYRRAGYKVGNMSAETIATAASRMAKKPHIAPIIAQRRRELADKAIWSREQALGMLKEIAVEARKNATENMAVNGTDIQKYNAAAQNVAIKAIEQANKMCGYNAPDKVDVDMTKRLEDII